jgi:hypothetical protein
MKEWLLWAPVCEIERADGMAIESGLLVLDHRVMVVNSH